MSLNPSSAFCAYCDATPDAKFSLNINAFNGNTTNFNRCHAPSSKSLPMPVQPRELPPSFSGTSIKTGGVIVRPF